MMKFAKIIEVGEHQVLVTKEYDSESDEFKLTARTDFEGFSQTLSMGFKTIESQNKAFEKFDISDAKKLINITGSLGIIVNDETE